MHGMPGRNENGERMIEQYIERVSGWKHVVQEGYIKVYMDETRT